MTRTDTISPLQADELKNLYFIGIGGIGMSAIARFFHSHGAQVSGYDRTQTELTAEMQKEGIDIHFTEDISRVPADAVVIYTPAVPETHKELEYCRSNGYTVVKRSEMLGAISRNSFNICIGGTHGKTTISTMVAHILRHSDYGCTAFLGGISVNYGTNFWGSENQVCVIEADEYDRSFLKLSPDIAVITAMDADHLDIYGSEEALQDAFIAFGNRVKNDGLLIGRFGLKRLREVTAARKISYSLQNESADAYASAIRIVEGGYQYRIYAGGEELPDMELRVGGMHNVENSVAAVAIAMDLEIPPEKIRSAIADFRGVRRRFEYIIPPEKQKTGGYIRPVLIDDYAHHPEELRMLLKSIRSLYPRRVVTIVFQPHLYSRTKDHAQGFAEVLSMADEVVLLPVYPAREEPIPGVSSDMILERISGAKKQLVAMDDLRGWISAHELNKEFGEVVVMAGAGDIDTLVQPVKKIIDSRS